MFTLSTLILSSTLVINAPSGDYEAALAAVEDASKEANRSVSAATIERLEQALLTIQRYPVELSRDAEGRERRALAQLNLARLQLINGNEPGAVKAMDQAIFSAGPDPLPADRFGPDIIALHEQRLAILEQAGRATLEVRCATPCEIYVDSNVIAGDSVDLHLGPHQLHVTSDTVEPMTRTVVLDAEGTVVEYGRELAPADPPAPTTEDKRRAKLKWGEVERPIPRWKLAGLGVSGGLFVGSFGAAIGLTVAIGPNGAFRRELLAAAEASLADDKPSNDVDPNGEGSLCATAQMPPDPSKPSEVTNGELTEICIRGDTWATMATSFYIISGVTAASTLVFGLLLNTHRVPVAARLQQRHQLGFAVVPRRDGGVTAMAGLRF